MRPKSKKGPKACPKSRESTAAKGTIPLRKSLRLAQSESSDWSDHILNSTQYIEYIFWEYQNNTSNYSCLLYTSDAADEEG